MGFWDSIGTGFTNIANQFASSNLGSTFLGQLGQYGVQQLGELIGIKPSSSGAPIATNQYAAPIGSMPMPALGPLGRPPVQYTPAQLDIPQLQKMINASASWTMEAKQRLLEEIMAVAPAAIPYLTGPQVAPLMGGGPVQSPFLTKKPAYAPPSVPASQPFGVMPGSGLPFGGSTMPSFPVTAQASFPANPVTSALFGGVQPASLAGSVIKQLPGFLGGIAGGELFESLIANGGGGGGTPMFRNTMAGARAQFFRTQNPATGQDTWFRPAGRPILWSGDLTACKRVNKVARRAKRKR